MIILEGPDGGGKSTLLTSLTRDLGLPAHQRSVRSDGSLNTDLDKWQWAVNDVSSWPTQELSVYDRHPLISEFIYGPIVRETLPDEFMSPHVSPLISRFAANSLVIFCLPPLEYVANNMSSADQMAGVAQKIKLIYYAYQSRMSTWPGWCLTYDYTKTMGKGSYPTVVRAAKLHMATFRRDHRA